MNPKLMLMVGREPIYVGPFDTEQDAQKWIDGTHTPQPWSLWPLEPPMFS